MQYIAFDAHKHYTLASVERQAGGIVREERIPHERGTLRQFLRTCDRGSPVAVETTGNWYWLTEARLVIATRLRDILMPLRRRREDSGESGSGGNGRGFHLLAEGRLTQRGDSEV